MPNTTTIPCSKRIRDELFLMKREGEVYDDVLDRLLDDCPDAPRHRDSPLAE